ncbi:MAG: tRNA epoxyqueuosine(34) reductase QueG [Chloroflexi bacterium HGW-Chloroflexi-1]|nr:MAG: tRNA epoxyqueuosine(34) reductase QueG [Chloroflexi bacterium HGW-Chloroflexi-1]
MPLTLDIRDHVHGLGFDLIGIVPVEPPEHRAAFVNWLAAGYHGEMASLANRAALRLDPRRLAPDARSMIVLAANYNPGPPPPDWAAPSQGRFARYAWAADYHDIIKPRLYELDAWIRARTGRDTPGKACVDTAPLLERDFAARAGLGFIGRNSCLITPRLGSWTFLAALLVPEDLSPSRSADLSPSPGANPTPSPSPAGGGERVSPFPHREGGRGVRSPCGQCTRCLDACPTGALVAPTGEPVGPYMLDARRCISYLTIELRGPIPRDLRPLMGNWVFGCDICQQVCPYNRAAPRTTWPALAPDPARAAAPLLDLLALDAASFRARYRGAAVTRTKRRGLVRNACVAAGNWGNPAAIPTLIPLLADPEPLVRGHASWALGCIGGRAAHQALARAAATEMDLWANEEISLARGAI